MRLSILVLMLAPAFALADSLPSNTAASDTPAFAATESTVTPAAAQTTTAIPVEENDTDPVVTTISDDSGVAPTPITGIKQEWITKAQFEKQLKLLHDKPLDDNLGFFGPQSMMWRMEKYISPPALGAGRALLLQISHPWVTAGIDEHSITRAAPLRRARDTFKAILTMVFGTKQQALVAAEQVRGLHNKVKGKLPYQAGAFPEGSNYMANEVQAMIWVHATLWETLMLMYEQSVGPVNDEQKEQYYQETKLFAYLFGIPEEALPRNWREFLSYCEKMRNSDQLVVTPAAKQLEEYLFNPNPLLWPLMQYQKVFTAANLPEKLRDGYGLSYGPISKTVYSSSMFASRIGHKIMPDFLLENPVYKEAKARIRGKTPSWFTRMQVKLLLGVPKLVADKELPEPPRGYAQVK